MWKCARCETINDDSQYQCVVCGRDKNTVSKEPATTEPAPVKKVNNQTVLMITAIIIVIVIVFILLLSIILDSVHPSDNYALDQAYSATFIEDGERAEAYATPAAAPMIQNKSAAKISSQPFM